MSNHHHSHDHDQNGACQIPSFTATEVIVKEDVIAKAKELAELISSSDEVRVYREAESKVNKHDEIQDIIKQIKKKQKEIVGFEYFKNEQMVAKIEQEIADLEGKLNQFPIVDEFKQTQEDINYLLQLIIGVVRDSVSEKISVEAGQATAEATYSD
jgi:cell fate (sporulation/competence/biofilm development) regulator YmcA (YheA/YmcA/DUF963 family)